MKFLVDIIKYGKLQNYKTEMDIGENRIQKLNMYLLSSSDPLNHQYEQQYGHYSSSYVNNTRNRNLTDDRYYNSESTIRLNVTRISMVILMSLKCD